MKPALIATAFLFLVVPTHAQDRANLLAFGGGGGFGTSSIGGGSFSLPITNRNEHYKYVYARGSTTTYIPTRFVRFETGLKLARQLQAYQPKSLGEIAAEYRAAKRHVK
ncbi:MAG TPA: hypothetical protein VKB26_09960 [Candidatus Acidoferrales bacterium]|nr:hypothetical protein [Candidatus Acidoferrales bacterium]